MPVTNIDPAQQTSTDVNKAGMGFAALISQLGQAVAETQIELNDITATNAQALADTKIEVIAARQKKYSDDGERVEETNLMMQLPLASYVELVSHEVSQLHIQGVFQSNGFQSDSHSGNGTTSSSSYAQLHVGAVFSSPSTSKSLARTAEAVTTGNSSGYRSGSSFGTNNTTDSESRSQTSYGQVRMNAEIRPRTDVGVPKPTHVIRGPEMTLVPLLGEENVVGGKLVERTMLMKLSYRRRPELPAPAEDGTVPAKPVAGAAIEGASFAIEAEGVQWNVADSTGKVATAAQVVEKSKTDKEGNVYYLLRRPFGPDEVDRSAKPIVFTARIGMLYANTVVSL